MQRDDEWNKEAIPGIRQVARRAARAVRELGPLPTPPDLDMQVVAVLPGGGFEVHVSPQDEAELIRRAKAAGFKVKKVRKAKEGKVTKQNTWTEQVAQHLGKAFVTHKVGLGPITGADLLLACEEGHEVSWHTASRIPPEAIATKLKREGWRLGRHPQCPEHNQQRRLNPKKEVKKVERKPQNQLRAVPQAPALHQTQQEASEAAREAKRLALGELEISFDIKEGRYKPGVSDESIAKELNIHPDVVTTLREQFYGPLKAPSEIEAFQLELGNLKLEIAQANANMNERVMGMFDRLEQLAKANGWKK